MSVSTLSRGAVMGDSITALTVNGSNWTDRAYPSWLRRFMGSSISLPASNVFATFGFTSAQILATWVPPCVAATPDWCIVMAGVNDLFTDPMTPPATTIANLTSIYQALIGAGIYVIALPIRVTGAFPQTPPAPPQPKMSAVQQAAQGYINNWIKNFCAATQGVTYIDVNLPFIDYTISAPDSTGALVSVARYDYLEAQDQVHDTPLGAIVTAQAIQSFLSTIIPARDDRFTLLADVYDATNNPTGNLLPNGLMAGFGGTLANGAQGYVPTGWFGDGNNGGALAVAAFNSTTPYPNCPGLTKTTMTLDGAWLDTSVPPLGLRTPSVNHTVTTGFTAGVDMVVGEIEADWDIGNDAIQSIYLALYFQNGGNVLDTVTDGIASGLGSWPTGTGRAVFRTEPVLVPANTNLISLFGFVWVSAGTVSATPVSATVNWARSSLRKVT